METTRDQTQKEISNWLEELEGEQDRLNDWERNFVADMQDEFGNKGKLSTGQYRTLKQIYERYF